MSELWLRAAGVRRQKTTKSKITVRWQPQNVKTEEEQQQDLFQAIAEQVLIRSAFATDAYLAIVTTIGAVVTPIYVVTLRLVFDKGPLNWLSWDALPAWLLLSSVLLISIIRFPRRAFFDTKQPAMIYIAQQERTYRLRLWSATAVLLAMAGLISSVVTLAQANVDKGSHIHSPQAPAALTK